MASIAIWYVMLSVLGLVTMPLTRLIFRDFRDGGWLFSKTLGLFLIGTIMWIFNVTRVLPFNRLCGLFSAALMLGIGAIILILNPNRRALFAQMSPKLIILEEWIFLVGFLLAVWIIGFKPEAYGTEKFMDYAFITAMLRNDYMPFADPWYAGKPINYYYGGQYLTAFLIRLSGVSAGYGYNLMRATIWSLSLALPYALIREMKTQADAAKGLVRRVSAHVAGLLSGLAVGICGNGHYLIFGLIIPMLDKISGGKTAAALGLAEEGTAYRYWFPDSTRYIGYFPDAPDKTIHEFPAYSSVLGDLHAHYIDLIFALTVTAVLCAWAVRRKHETVLSDPSIPSLLKEALLNPALMVVGVMTGVFKWTNYWDFPIYFVTAVLTILFVQIKLYRRDPFRLLVNVVLETAEIFALGFVASLPFTAKFDMIASEVLPTTTHTPFYQLLILWGVPALTVIWLAVMMIRESVTENAGKMSVLKRLDKASVEDLVLLVFGCCALGLIFLTEIIYVKDIYGGEFYRANTMFKLTYQAFVLLGLVMGYTFMKAFDKKSSVCRVFAIIGMVYIVLTSGYSLKAVDSWFSVGTKERVGTDASVFISESFPSDYGAVNWLNTHVEGDPVIVEATGDSYSTYGRVSTATGLPTILGWYVHEWLWRSDLKGPNERAADIETLYTSENPEVVKNLIRKYGVTYIYIGTLERQKYGTVSDKLLQSLGEVVYSDGETTYIMKVS